MSALFGNVKNQERKSGFTTTSEGYDESLLSSSPNAVGGNVYRAFTLIELLVVIAIISLLSSLVLASLSSARASARDARRVQDLRQMKTALEMYYNDHGQYPSEINCDDTNYGTSYCDPGGTGWLSTAPLWQGLVGDGYMQKLPIDPINNDTYKYWYEEGSNDGRDFCLRSRLESGGFAYEHGGEPPYPLGNCGL